MSVVLLMVFLTGKTWIHTFLFIQENYLSEYNYNESLDEDNARKLLNFGDDYRNFMGSMSEDQSSINANDTHGQSSKNTRRKSRKKMVCIFYITSIRALSSMD